MEAANRELKRDTGLEGIALRQFYTFGDNPTRDAIVRLVTIGYYGLIDISNHKLASVVKGKNASWFPINNLPDLAFDHDEIIKKAYSEMKKDLVFHPIFQELLPPKFSLSGLQNVFEKIFGCSFDNSNFRKKIIDSHLVIDLNEYETDVSHRAARLYAVSDLIREKDPLGLLGFLGSLVPREFKK